MNFLKSSLIGWASLLALAPFAFAAGPGTWALVSTSRIDSQMSYAGFLSETHGIAVGPEASVNYTQDGGKSWQSGVNSSMCLFGIEILDDKTAWICGNNGQVRFSDNGGTRWQAISNFGAVEPGHPKFVSFSDPTHGAVATYNKVGLTQDGGKTWTHIKTPDAIKKVASIHSLGATTLWVLSAEGVLYRTDDGGQTWQDKAVEFKDRKTTVSKPWLYPTCAFRFTSSKDGLLVTYSLKPKKELLVLKTADGGATWEEQAVPEGITECESIYLSRDGNYITLLNKGKVQLLKHQGDL